MPRSHTMDAKIVGWRLGRCLTVMAGRIPAIRPPTVEAQMAGTRPISVKIARAVVSMLWPALCRPSTTGGADRGKVVDGRDKRGHDTMGTTVPPTCYFDANAGHARP